MTDEQILETLKQAMEDAMNGQRVKVEFADQYGEYMVLVQCQEAEIAIVKDHRWPSFYKIVKDD